MQDLLDLKIQSPRKRDYPHHIFTNMPVELLFLNGFHKLFDFSCMVGTMYDQVEKGIIERPKK